MVLGINIYMSWLGLGLGLILSLRSAQNRFMPTNMIFTDLITNDEQLPSYNVFNTTIDSSVLPLADKSL